MRFMDVKKGCFALSKGLVIILICQVLIVSAMTFLALNVQPQWNGAEPSLYHTYEEMVSELQKIETNHSSIVELHNLTTTSQGRTVWAVKISDHPQLNDSTEPDVLFMGGQQANSLISVEIALNLISHLSNNYGQDSSVTELVNNREIWVIPLANPDGHAYVGNETQGWMKNRHDNGDGTFGVNLDRNYGFNWGGDDNTSDDTNNQYYHGIEPFSEVETTAIRTLVESQNFVFSLSFSSSSESGKIITYPWGYTTSPISDNDDYILLSEIASDMAMYSGYDVKQGGEHQLNHGNADDWLYNNASVLPFTALVGTEDIPEESQIGGSTQRNIPACLYLLDIADNPSRALEAEWTFMVYMGGDNNLEDEGIKDFNEMETIGSNPYVNIVVQFDRASGGISTNPDWDDTRRFLVMKDYDEEKMSTDPLQNIGEADMDDEQTLLSFVNWSITNFPAEHYFLDIWGHGQGWLGVTSDINGYLSMNGIKSVLPQFKDKIDVVGFDNCNMAMIEVYTQFIGHTDYIVGSEKEEDAFGWPYDRIFNDLVAEPETSPLDLSALIAWHYVDWAQGYNSANQLNSSYSATVSVVDMDVLPDVINRTDILARELDRMLALYMDEIGEVMEGPDKAEQYGRKPYPHDLYHFAELIAEKVPNAPIKIAAEKVMDAIENLVVAEEHWTSPNDEQNPVNNAHGITVWLYDGNFDFQKYEDLDFAKLTYWDEFLAAYKNPLPKPQVDLQMSYTLLDSDEDGNDDTIDLLFTTNVTGLNITMEVFNFEHLHISTLYINGTVQGTERNLSFYPDDDYPSDYYDFYAYLVNGTNAIQNYNEVVDVWLGNEKPEVILKNITFYRKDGTAVGGSTGKKPVDAEITLISVQVENNGNIPLLDLDIEFFEGDNLIITYRLNLGVGEEKNITVQWLARAGERSIRVVVDRENLYKEINESNNEILEIIDVKSNIPGNDLKLTGRVINMDNINIIDAKVRIRNMRTNETINTITKESGYEVTLTQEWYLEGDMIDVKATYASTSNNLTVYAYSEDEEIKAELILDTDVYDALFFFKIGLIIFEIIGFALVLKYYIGTRWKKGGV